MIFVDIYVYIYCSVGSLGKYPHEQDVSGIFVSHSSLKGTTNGVRIKSWPGSPPSRASGIIFDDITMDSVKNPIIIDQKYGSHTITAVIYILFCMQINFYLPSRKI
jgi:hypothetical protein